MQRYIALLLCGFIVSSCSSGGVVSMTPAVPAAVPQNAAGHARRELPEPPEVDAVHGVATVSLAVEINPATAMPEFVFAGQRGVAPTIRLNPGDKIVMDVANELPPNGGMGSDVNIHFHGLTVSPEPPADNVTTMLALPGRTLHYIVPIPKAQQPGLYWYHPHVFPETNYQVGQSGMSGAIVVNGLQTHLPALSKMKERLIIIRDIATAVANEMPMRPHDLDTNNNPCGPDPGLQVTLNGVVRPTIPIARNEAQFFRVINATGHKNLNLAVDNGTLEVVAIDGYALDAYPGTPPTQIVSSLVVPPSSRAEFVVRGSPSGSSEFRTLCYNSGPTGDPDPMVILADLRATPAEKRDATLQGNVPARLRAAAPLPAGSAGKPAIGISAHRTVVLSEDTNGMYINGQKFSMNALPMFTVQTGTVEQWQIVNITEEVHDFHIHQVHFLVQQVNGNTVTQPHWADSVVVPHRIPGKNGSWTPGYLTVLMDFRSPIIKGTFMFHCHILDHEDSGMMAKIQAI